MPVDDCSTHPQTLGDKLEKVLDSAKAAQPAAFQPTQRQQNKQQTATWAKQPFHRKNHPLFARRGTKQAASSKAKRTRKAAAAVSAAVGEVTEAVVPPPFQKRKVKAGPPRKVGS